MISREYFDYQILRLTDSFYDAYPNPPYTEIASGEKTDMLNIPDEPAENP